MDYQYDLFISFKNSTELGLTKDREIADRFYETLTKKDFRVFFSNIVLSDKGIANYMLEIQNALEGSRAILVVFSEVEYISSGWVAQEWMTFLNLLLKDPNRNIYVYSIKNDTSQLPPFLRPYECFGDYKAAIHHLTNGLGGESVQKSQGFGKRDFLNAYWGLFGNTDIYDYLDKPMSDHFYNYGVYCIRSKYLLSGDAKNYILQLKKLIDETENPLASFLLSRHYRSVDYLDLAYSRRLAADAWESFHYKVEHSVRNGEIGLWILSERNEYDGAFYLCDVIHDVLDAYNVTTCIRIVSPDALEELDFETHRKIVLFLSEAEIEVPETFLETMRRYREKMFIGLNAFGPDTLCYNIRDFQLFENSNMDITKICRILLS